MINKWRRRQSTKRLRFRSRQRPGAFNESFQDNATVGEAVKDVEKDGRQEVQDRQDVAHALF